MVEGTGLGAPTEAQLMPVLANVAAFKLSGVEVFLNFPPPLTITNPGLIICC
jgi:hypothetical protein